MKFTYDKPDTDTRECVAYIDGEGDLIIWDCEGGNAIALVYGHAESGHDWTPSDATHKFYRGDSVTITF